jgi:hypothetical protein
MLIPVAVIFFCGCDPDWPSAHTTCEVRGQIKLEGKPVVDAKVVFVPQRLKANSKVSQIASGTSDDRGEFFLEIDSRKPKQIAHDRYRVLISKVVDGEETLHQSYNSKSVLEYDVKTQEAFDRPVFELKSTGTM